MPRSPLESVAHDQVIRAGAGAGKTYTLTRKALQLAKDFRAKNGRWPRLVLTTFTRAATQELRERVLKYALEDHDKALIEFASSNQHLVISTLHGLADRFLRQACGRIGLDPAFRVLDSSQSIELRRRAFHRILKSDEVSKCAVGLESAVTWLEWLDQLAQHRVLFPDLRPLSLAELKLEAEVARSELEADRVALMDLFTSSNSSLERREQEILRGWSGSISEVWAHIDRPERASELVRDINMRIGSKSGPYVQVKQRMKEFRERLLGYFSNALYFAAGQDEFSERTNVLVTLLPLYIEELRRLKLEMSALGLEDLEPWALELSRHASSGEPTPEADQFGSGFDHWLIDEYQDTNPSQVQLIRLWSSKRPRFVVGDPQQSIYLFRDAKAEVFADAEKQACQVDGLYELSTNRRSNPDLLRAINLLVGQFNGFRTMESATDSHSEVSTGHPEVATRYRSQAPPILISRGAPDIEAESEALVRWVRSQIEFGRPLSSIVVLVRRHRDGLRVAAALRKAGISFSLSTRGTPRDRPEVRLLHALIAFLVDIERDDELAFILRQPFFGCSDSAWARLISRARSERKGVWYLLRADPEFAQLPSRMLLLQLLERSQLNGPLSAVSEIFFEAGLLRTLSQNDRSGLSEAVIVQALADLANRTRAVGFSWLSYLLRAEEATESELGDARPAVAPNRVQIMTIHASKGLEFEAVAIPFLGSRIRSSRSPDLIVDDQSGIWSLAVKFQDLDKSKTCHSQMAERVIERKQEAERDERRRLVYVALTRAQAAVYISIGSPDSTSLWSELNLNLSEKDSDLVQSRNWDQELVEGRSDQPSSEASLPQEWPAATALREANAFLGRRLSASRLVEGNSQRTRVKSENSGLIRGLERAEVGTQVHRLLEVLCYPSRDRIAAALKHWFADDEGQKTAHSVLEAVRFCLENSVLSALFECGSAEWGFVWRTSGITVEGQIDLWGNDRDGRLWVVDYKTGQSDDPSQAWRQLDVYSAALFARDINLKSINQMIVYPFDQKTLVREARSKQVISSAVQAMLQESLCEIQADP